jgi:hypothetical protein
MADPFQPKFVDLVRNFTTTTGTANFTLGPAVNGFTGFAQALQAGDRFYYSAIGVDKPAEREVGRGTLLAGGAIGREPISGTKTNFTAGTKSVALIAAAEWFTAMQAAGGGADATAAPAIAATRAELAGVSDQQKPVVLCEPGREGIFAWDPANLSTAVAGDPRQAIYVAPASAPSGASGAWVRRHAGPKNAGWFGAIGDGITDNAVALQAWLDSGGHLYLPAGEYFSSAKLIVRKHVIIDGAGYGFDSRRVTGGATFGQDDMPGARIRFAAGVGGLDCQPQTAESDVATAIAAGSAGYTQEGAMHSHIRRLALVGMGGAAATGFHARTKVHCEHVHVYTFSGTAYDVSASVDAADGNSEYGAADLSTFKNCRASSNGGHGFHVRGREANVCHFDTCDAINNAGWGYLNEAISSSLYSNCHAATNSLGSFKATSQVGDHVFVGCYVEGGTGENCALGSPPEGHCVVVGGNLAYVAIHNNDVVNVPNTIAAQQIRGNYYLSTGQDALGASLTNGEAAFHGHFNYGAVIQGSVTAGSYDVSLFNKAGSFVAGVVTGQSVFRVAGQHQLLNGNIFFNDVGAAFQGFGGPGNGYQTVTLAGGLNLYGRGTSYDVSLNNMSGAAALRIPTNTVNVEIAGTVSASNLGGTNSGDETPATIVTKIAAQAIAPASVAATGNVTSSGGGVGYAAGAGGSVTQATSKSTAVTLNKSAGRVTTHAASLANGAVVSFVVNNSQVAATDTINLNLQSGNAAGSAYRYWVEAVSAGSFRIVIENRSGAALAEALLFNFAVLKAVTA